MQTQRRWADKITVKRDGDNLYVRGENATTHAEGQSPDLLNEYVQYVGRIKPLPDQLRGGSLAPHIRFAHADSDEKLVDYVRRYGPLNGLPQAPGPLTRRSAATFEVRESLQRLCRERMVVAAGLALVVGLREGSDIRIANALSDLIRACSQPGSRGELAFETEYILKLLGRAARKGWQGSVTQLGDLVSGLTGERAREYGWYMLCFMLNTFPTALVPAKRGLIELPQQSKAGILPALFFMLRRDCVLDHEIRICGRRDCGQFFKVERGGQRYCSAECSQLQRQRDYWQRKGRLRCGIACP